MKLVKIAFFLAFLSINALALTEGKEYEVLKNPLNNANKSLIEVFSFSCGVCYNHHKFDTLAKLQARLPSLNFKSYPFKNTRFGQEFAQLYAYANAQDELKKKDELSKDSLSYKVADVYFTAIFERNQNWSDSQSFYELGLKSLNISKAELDKFTSNAKAKFIQAEYDKLYPALMQYGGTPTFVVNGKYIIRMQEIKGFDELVAVIDALSKL